MGVSGWLADSTEPFLRKVICRIVRWQLEMEEVVRHYLLCMNVRKRGHFSLSLDTFRHIAMGLYLCPGQEDPVVAPRIINERTLGVFFPTNQKL